MDKVLNYLFTLERFGIKLGLEVMQRLMEKLNYPEQKFKSIHITGTNGKGSTAAFLSQILKEAGYKVGLYTSPHLVSFNERIKINGENISDNDIKKLTFFIRKVTEENSIQPTFFEFTTALAFLYFAQQKVDYAVIEVGMGGRLDATNILRPELAIITSVSFDHTAYLGETLLAIASEKAGIIKKDTPTIISEENQQLIAFFGQVCREKQALCHILDKEVKYLLKASNLDGQIFTTEGKINDLFHIKLLGQHQVRNAVTAIIAALFLNINIPIIKEGLLKTYWPGRLEILRKKPLIFIDGAHNAAGMRAVKDFFTPLPQPKVILLGISKDKQIDEMVSLIVPLAKSIIISQGNYKPANMEIIERACRKYSSAKIFKIAEIKEAIMKALQETSKNNLLLITGSLYLVGDVLTHRGLFFGNGPT